MGGGGGGINTIDGFIVIDWGKKTNLQRILVYRKHPILIYLCQKGVDRQTIPARVRVQIPETEEGLSVHAGWGLGLIPPVCWSIGLDTGGFDISDVTG